MGRLSSRLRRSYLKRRLAACACPYLIWPYKGVHLLLNSTEKTDRLVILKHKESQQLDRMIAWMEGHRPSLFLDVGANFGLYSTILGRRFPDLAVHAFEPVPDVRVQLQANLLINHIENVTVHAAAASDVDGDSVFLREVGGHTGISRVKDEGPGAPLDRGEWREITVPVRRLDGVIGLRGGRLAVKIDVEGHEVHVLKGMADLLAGNDCYLQVEISPLRPGNLEFVTPFLAQRGYALVDRIDVDHVFTRA
jgi:FkbM family methyltransferase